MGSSSLWRHSLIGLLVISLGACGGGDDDDDDDDLVGDDDDDDDNDAAGDDDDDDDGLPTSCADALAADPGTPSGSVTIDPDGEGDVPPFEVECDMDGDEGGWTLVGVVDNQDEEAWTDFEVWGDASTFGAPGGGDYKNAGWGSLPAIQLRLVGSGTKVSDNLGTPTTLAELFSSSTLLSLSGTERDWNYNNGDFTLERDAEFFLEVQNPPMTNEVNRSQRNACVLATAYDGWDRGDGPDDQVGGFGCVDGFGGGADGLCGNDSCGDTSRESTTQFFIR